MDLPTLPPRRTGTIQTHLGRSTRDRMKQAVVPENRQDARHAVTHYQVLETFGVLPDVVRVDHLVSDQHVHHCEHHRNVGSWKRLDEVISCLRRERANRVDHHDSCSSLSCLLDERPKMPVGQAGVGSPQQDVLGMANIHRIGPERTPQCQSCSRRCCCTAK